VRYRVARLHDLPDGHGWLVEVAGEEIALFRQGDRVHALENDCPHRGAALAFGDLRGGIVYCPLHAWGFAVETGVCSEFPASPARAFVVHVEGDDVWLEL
jgi:nitrite reductase (NADH) small subunit